MAETNSSRQQAECLNRRYNVNIVRMFAERKSWQEMALVLQARPVEKKAVNTSSQYFCRNDETIDNKLTAEPGQTQSLIATKRI